ncbi:winged helix-turn-helix domain-containing protein [Streptosporangium sp. KLBMP 9127]|nr:winged helix-turn-helix domain-containing protein [Streptosporangium sp. KLBMP 9127]
MLLPLLRSNAVGELLAWLYLHPEGEYSTTDLAARVGASQSTVSREADRFFDAGLTVERRHGNLRLIRADTDTIVAKPLTDLLAVTFGPAAILPPFSNRSPVSTRHTSMAPGPRDMPTRPDHPP